MSDPTSIADSFWTPDRCRNCGILGHQAALCPDPLIWRSRAGYWTLVHAGGNKVVPFEIKEKDRKVVREISGSIYDLEGAAKLRAREWSADPTPKKFSPYLGQRVLITPRAGPRNPRNDDY